MPADGVLAKDGQHVIPFDVLEEARRKISEERGRADRLQAELDAAQQPPPDQTPDAVPDAWQAQRSTLDGLLQEALADGDRELAEAYRAQISQGDQIVELRSGMAELRQAVGRTAEEQHQREVSAEQQQIEAALATSPLLGAWAADTAHPMWHQTAVDLHNALLADPNSDYPRMSWEQRFAALPALVEAHFGVRAPHRGGGALPGGAAVHPRAQVPYSISGIPGAQPVASGLPRGPADIGDLPGREQTKYLVGRYADGRLFNNLRDFPIGSLNTGGRHPV
jgi:hypothetical protein